MPDKPLNADSSDTQCCERFEIASRIFSDPEADPDDAWFGETLMTAVRELGLQHEAARTWRNIDVDVRERLSSAQVVLAMRCTEAKDAVQRSESAARLHRWIEECRRGAQATDGMPASAVTGEP